MKKQIKSNDFKLGVVLSGGLAKGAYQIGFINALLKYFRRDQIEYVSGASIGICNAYALSANKIPEIVKLWHSIDSSNIFSLWKELVLKKFIKKNIVNLVEEDDTLNIPMYITTLSVFPKFNFKYVRFAGSADMRWRDLIRGSIGFPVVTGSQVYFNRKFYTDGGVVDNIPIQPLLNKNLDLIIVLHFDPSFNILRHCTPNNDNVLEIDLSVCSNFEKKSFDFSQKNISKMIKQGFEYGEELCKKLVKSSNKKKLVKTVNSIVTENQRVRAIHDSLDKWPTRLNRVFKKHRFNNVEPVSVDTFIENTKRKDKRIYCENCQKDIKSKKKFNWLLFLSTFWFGVGIIYLLIYLFTSPKCEYCKKNNFEATQRV